MSNRGGSTKMPDKAPRSPVTAGKQPQKPAENGEQAARGNDAGKRKTFINAASATRAEKSHELCLDNETAQSCDRNPGVSKDKNPRSVQRTGNGEVKKKAATKSTRAKTGYLEDCSDSNNNPAPTSPICDTKKNVIRSVRKEPMNQNSGAPEGNKVQTDGKLKESNSLDETKGKTKDKKQSPPDGPGAVRKQKSIEPCSPSDPDKTGNDPVTPTSAKGKHKPLLRSESSMDKNPDKILRDVLEKLKVKKSDITVSSKCVNDIEEEIISHLKENLDWCQDIKALKTGSYYEHVKICEPDEFDVMLTVKKNRVKVIPFSEDGAFYSVELQRDPKKNLEKFIDDNGTIKASEMLKEFREEVKKAVESLKKTYKINVNRKKKGCPAVTLEVNQDGKQISIDFVLGLEVEGSWPAFTNDGLKIEKWLSNKVRLEQRRKPYYLVPKYEGKGNAEQDGVTARDAWRISFSHVEKDILANHGNSKTCCKSEGSKCCRKDCLKLLKYLVQKLKEIHPKEADDLCSYHAKTTLLHACASRVTDSTWAASDLNSCFQQLLEDFGNHLEDGQLSNFFIPPQNLFKSLSQKERDVLLKCIQYQRNNGYPLFQQGNTGGTPKQTVPKLGVCDCQVTD